MRMPFLTILMIVPFLLTPLPSYAESPPLFALGLGLEIANGTFGSGSAGTYATAPMVVDWFPTERLDVELTVPFLYQRTTTVGHAVLGTGFQSPAKSVESGGMYGAGDSVSLTSGSVSPAGGTMGGAGGGGSMFGGEYGLGDITLTSGYIVMIDSDTSPQVRPTLYLKFPTADERKGFGTGEFDFGAGLAVSKWMGNWQPFAEGRYIVQGGSYEATGAPDFVTADAGVAFSWSERFATSAYARFGSRLFVGLSAPLEARLKTVWRFVERSYIEAYALKGFSDGSPDYGGGFSVFREF